MLEFQQIDGEKEILKLDISYKSLESSNYMLIKFKNVFRLLKSLNFDKTLHSSYGYAGLSTK